MKINSLGSKIGSGFLLTALLLTIVVGTTLSMINSTSNNTEKLINDVLPINHQSLVIQSEVNRALAALRGWVSFNEDDYNKEFNQAWDNIQNVLESLSNHIHGKNILYSKSKFVALEKELEQLYRYQIRVRDIAHNPDNQPGMRILKQQATPLAASIYDEITHAINLEMLEAEENKRKAILKAMADFRGSMANSVAQIRGFLLTADLTFKSGFDRFWQLNESSLAYLNEHKSELSKQQNIHLLQIVRLRDRFEPYIEQMFTFRQSVDWDKSQKWMKLEVAPLERSIRNRIKHLVEFEQGVMDSQLTNIRSDYESLISITSLLLFAGLVLSVALAIYITKLVVKPLQQVMTLADKISKGELEEQVQLRGALEIEHLSASLQKMLDVLLTITSHANRVAQGQYDKDFEPQSEKDRLGIALKSMTSNLRQADQLTTQQDWLKSGLSGMSDCLRDAKSLDNLTQEALTYLCRYTEAKVGALYLRHQNSLELSKSFAFKMRNNNDNQFVIGEGMIGQVAKEKKMIVFQDVPNDHCQIEVNSGLGGSRPNDLLILPILNDQRADADIVGVMALGFTQKLSEIKLELLRKLTTTLATAIESAIDQQKLQELLEESQQQMKQLQEQQEELAASNAELEEQTQSLSQAEEELRAQREDLQRSNDALKEKTSILEQKNQEIEQKNETVEASKMELEKRAFELEQASRYKSEFLANMSHELRTPLNSLLILSQIMAENRKGNLSDDQLEDIKMIHNGGKSLLSLINDILDLSKVEAGKLKLHVEPLDLQTFSESLASQFDCQAKEKNVDFRVRIAPATPKQLKTDKLRLEQILRNLLSNAIKFTERGEVSLNVEPATGKDEDANDVSSAKIAFRVKDTGCGIAKEKQKDIFEAFQQGDGSTSRKYGGTGLGLAISRELSRLLGGEITLISEEGQGSEFTLVMPIEPVVEVECDEDAEDLPAQAQFELNETSNVLMTTSYIEDDRGKTCDTDQVLLIVEDDPTFAKTLLTFAHQNGFRALVTDKGIEALELVMQFVPHAIILDLGLPDMDGFKVLDGLKQSPMTKDIPVHIISGRELDEEQEVTGAISFLHKPADKEKLDELFKQFSSIDLNTYRNILLIEDDEVSCHAIRSYLEENNIAITSVNSGEEGLAILQEQQFDCVILDLNLRTMTGQEWLDQAATLQPSLPPVIIYTGKDLSNAEYQTLQKYTNSVVIKGSHSQQRLKDEVSLFLYDVESKRRPLSQVQSQIDLEQVQNHFDGKRVLVVDDDIRNVYALSKTLKQYGMDVIIADNGELALDKLEQESRVDLILMDIMMPKMDGYEAIRHIRKKYKEQHPIIALTAKAMPEDRKHCIDAGANDYLAKPVDINQLVSMVKVWLYQ